MKRFLVLPFLALSVAAHADIKVAFFSTLTRTGELVQFEPGGQFSHVAISYKSGWLHVDPARGVEFVRTLDQIGHLSSILSNPSLPELNEAQVSGLIGLPYDRNFGWSNERATYCSKLVANLLGIDPTPMAFGAKGWTGIGNLPKGDVGLSPDDIYASLIRRNFKRTYVNCSDILRGLFKARAN